MTKKASTSKNAGKKVAARKTPTKTIKKTTQTKTKAAKSAVKPIKAFFAGDLFSSKDLIGNQCLQEELKNVSNGKYNFFLAQNKVQQNCTHKAIKDQDLMGLMESEVAIFAFDGVELDSGTVVEFMVAKQLDIPSVVYRTDFRGGSGEEEFSLERGNKWNLMASYYPRTKYLYMNAMMNYQKKYTELNGKTSSAHKVVQAYSEQMAETLTEAMDEVMTTKPIFNPAERQKLKEQCIKLFGIDAPVEFLKRMNIKK